MSRRLKSNRQQDGGSNKMTAGGGSLLLFVVEAGMGPRRKQQNDSRPGLIVAFFRGRKNRARAEATKWQPSGSHCCFLFWRQEWDPGGNSKMATAWVTLLLFLSWRQEWDLGGSNKMAIAWVSLLLFVVKERIEPGRKQQNGSRPG